MNPEAGFIDPLRSVIERVHKDRPSLAPDDVIRIARAIQANEPTPVITSSRNEHITPLEFDF